jgi:hypothetical protein
MLRVFTKDLKTYCDTEEVCTLNIGVELVDTTKSKRLEVSVYQVHGAPKYLEKNIMINDIAIGYIRKKYYFDIGKGSSGEVLIDLKRGYANILATVVQKTDVPPEDIDSEPDWRGVYEFPYNPEQNIITFDSSLKKIPIISGVTEMCENGCYVLIVVEIDNDEGVFIDEETGEEDEKLNYLPHQLTILPKIISQEDEAVRNPILKVRMNEFIFGNVYPASKDLYDFYQVILPFESDYIMIDWQADKASLLVRIGEEKPRDDNYHFMITPKNLTVGRITLKEIREKTGNPSLVLKGLTVTFAVKTEKIDSIITSPYAFRLFMPPMFTVQDYKEQMALELIHIKSDQKVQCDPIGFEGFYSCLFAVIYEESDNNKTLIAYPRARDEFVKVTYVAEEVPAEQIEKNDVKYIIEKIPTPNETYNSFNGYNK